jgi:hypothetical protein
MKQQHKSAVKEVVSTLDMPREYLSNRDVKDCVESLREVLDDLLYFYQDGDQTVACIENCIYYLEEMLELDSDDEDYEINLGVVRYELNKLL